MLGLVLCPVFTCFVDVHADNGEDGGEVEGKSDKGDRSDEATQTKDKQGCMDNGERSIFTRECATDDSWSDGVYIQTRYSDDGPKFFSQSCSIFITELHYEGDIFPLVGGPPNKCGGEAQQCCGDGGHGGQEYLRGAQ